MPITLIAPALTFLRLLALPLIALAACLWAARRATDNRRLVFLAHGVFLASAIALTCFWQLRVGIYMELFALAPLCKLLCDAWGDLEWRLGDRPLFWAEIGIFLLLGPLPTLIIPAFVAHAPLYPGIMLFPAARGPASCPLAPVTPFLNGMKPQTIMNGSDSGPEILFTTPHKIVAGNFDVPGNADAFAFFNATDDSKAKAAARVWNAGLVLVCRTAPTLYLGKDYYSTAHTRLQKSPDGMLRMVNIDTAQPLIERLIRGQIPVWLKPIEIPGQSDYLLFQIQDSTGSR